MKKSLPIILWALALLSPIAHMLVYHFCMEGWDDDGYATGMFMSALAFTVGLVGGGAAAADKYWE